MKKLERKVIVVKNESKVIEIICDLIDGRIEGDWNEYDKYEEVKYDFDLKDEDYFEMLEDVGVSIEDVKEFIGEGVCLIWNEVDEVWYNVSIKDNVMLVEWLLIEI